MTEIVEDGRTRLAQLFATARSENRAALLPYLTAGLPDPDASVEIFVAMADAGADGFEIGIPYADPLMDGPVIMEAGERALASGVTVDVALDVARRVNERTGKPLLMMTYVNPVLRIGIEEFFAKVVAAGAAGVILADLPVDEAGPFLEAAEQAGIGMALFAAPTTDDRRLTTVMEARPSFVYAVAEVGVTGERVDASVNTERLAARIASHAGDRIVPIVFGVGISTPQHAAKAAVHGDGVIVGTALVRRLLAAEGVDQATDSLSAAVLELATAVRR
jgi:tryptophan synthase alpha chain